MSPKTEAEWWDLLNDNWDDLLSIFWQFLPMYEHTDYQRKITVKPLYQIILDCKKARNPEIVRYLNGVWSAAPDNSSIHYIPSWHILCDLCSEEYVLYEEENFI